MTTNATRIDLKRAKSLAKAGLRKVNISINVLRDFMPETYNNHPCFAPWTHALIDHVNRVSVCCMMPNKPIIGDLRKQSFKQIWTGENFAALRQTQNLPMFESCQKCDMFLENNRRLAEIVYS